MDCNTALGYIEPFLNNEMTDEEKEGFIKHINSCKDCRNELEFYYITYSVFDESDKDMDSNNLDYIAALDRKLRLSKKGVSRRRMLRRFAIAAIVIIFLVIAAVLLFKGSLG